jgi:hypothetical protein
VKDFLGGDNVENKIIDGIGRKGNVVRIYRTVTNGAGSNQ